MCIEGRRIRREGLTICPWTAAVCGHRPSSSESWVLNWCSLPPDCLTLPQHHTPQFLPQAPTQMLTLWSLQKLIHDDGGPYLFEWIQSRNIFGAVYYSNNLKKGMQQDWKGSWRGDPHEGSRSKGKFPSPGCSFPHFSLLSQMWRFTLGSRIPTTQTSPLEETDLWSTRCRQEWSISAPTCCQCKEIGAWEKENWLGLRVDPTTQKPTDSFENAVPTPSIRKNLI